MHRLSTLLLLVLTLPEAHAQTGTTFLWATTQGNWEAAENWDPPDEGPPGSMDDALIIGTANVFINGGATVKNLTYSVVLGPGSLGFTTDGGNGGGDLTVLETMAWTRGGGWRSIGTLTVNGTFNLQADQYDHTAGTIVNNGMATWQSGTFSGALDDPIFRNEGDLLLAPLAGEDLTFCFHNGLYLTNAPTGMVSHTGEGRTLVQCQFENKGVVTVDGGELAFGGALNGLSADSYEGPFLIGSGRLAFVGGSDHIFESSATILGTTLVATGSGGGNPTELTVQGILDVDTLRAEASSLVRLNGPTTLRNVVLSGPSATLSGSASYAIAEGLDWENGSFGGTGTTTVPLDLAFDGAGGRLVEDSRTLRFTGETTWSNGAAVDALGMARVINAGTLSNDGPATTRDWGRFRNEGSFFNEVGLTLFEAFTNLGTVFVEGGEVRPPAALDGPDTGRYQVEAGGFLNFAGARTLAPGSVIGGTGTVSTPSTVTNSATWEPGDIGLTGTLTTLGFFPEPDLRLDIQLLGTTPDFEHDVLVITGSHSLGGTLDVSLLGGYVPEVGDAFAVVSCPGFCSGRFDVPANDTLTVGDVTFRVVYNASDVTLEAVSVAADFDLTVTSTSPLTVAPGDALSFDYSITNNTAAAASGDFYYVARRGGSGVVQGIVQSGTLPGGATVGGSVSLGVPVAAPAGAYELTFSIGSAFGLSVEAETFTVNVSAARIAATRDASATQEDTPWRVLAATPWIVVATDAGAPTATPAQGAPVTAASASVPEVFALHAAYPNPFNPSTTLRYDVPQAGSVRVAVYDALGREVDVLVDAERPAGTHTTLLDARALASGFYLVRMTAETFVQVRTITLLR